MNSGDINILTLFRHFNSALDSSITFISDLAFVSSYLVQ